MDSTSSTSLCGDTLLVGEDAEGGGPPVVQRQGGAAVVETAAHARLQQQLAGLALSSDSEQQNDVTPAQAPVADPKPLSSARLSEGREEVDGDRTHASGEAQGAIGPATQQRLQQRLEALAGNAEQGQPQPSPTADAVPSVSGGGQPRRVDSEQELDRSLRDSMKLELRRARQGLISLTARGETLTDVDQKRATQLESRVRQLEDTLQYLQMPATDSQAQSARPQPSQPKGSAEPTVEGGGGGGGAKTAKTGGQKQSGMVAPGGASSHLPESVTRSSKQIHHAAITPPVPPQRPSGSELTPVEEGGEDEDSETWIADRAGPMFQLNRTPAAYVQWDTLPRQSVQVYTNNPVEDMDQLQQQNATELGFARVQPTNGSSMEDWSVKIATAPFAAGAMRYAFHAQVYGEADSTTSYVCKLFQDGAARSNTRKEYLAQIEVSTISAFLAKEFNRTQNPRMPIHFLPSHVLKVDEGGSSTYYNLEPPLPGEFDKFSNNWTYWSPSLVDEDLPRFTLWTYEVTNQFMMVTDLQGTRCEDGYYLTDPAIHCLDNARFGDTNGGERGMAMCSIVANQALDGVRANQR